MFWRALHHRTFSRNILLVDRQGTADLKGATSTDAQPSCDIGCAAEVQGQQRNAGAPESHVSLQEAGSRYDVRVLYTEITNVARGLTKVRNS